MLRGPSPAMMGFAAAVVLATLLFCPCSCVIKINIKIEEDSTISTAYAYEEEESDGDNKAPNGPKMNFANKEGSPDFNGPENEKMGKKESEKNIRYLKSSFVYSVKKHPRSTSDSGYDNDDHENTLEDEEDYIHDFIILSDDEPNIADWFDIDEDEIMKRDTHSGKIKVDDAHFRGGIPRAEKRSETIYGEKKFTANPNKTFGDTAMDAIIQMIRTGEITDDFDYDTQNRERSGARTEEPPSSTESTYEAVITKVNDQLFVLKENGKAPSTQEDERPPRNVDVGKGVTNKIEDGETVVGASSENAGDDDVATTGTATSDTTEPGDGKPEEYYTEIVVDTATSSSDRVTAITWCRITRKEENSAWALIVKITLPLYITILKTLVMIMVHLV